MLKKETINAIAKVISVDAEELAKAISDEKEQDVSIPKITTYTEDEWEKFQERIEKEKDDDRRIKFNEGREIGVKAEVNRLSEAYGVNLSEKKKTFENFVDEFQKKIIDDANIEPNKKVKEMESDLEKVREQVKIYEESLKAKETEYNSNLKNYKIQNELEKIIPDKLTNIEREDAKIIAKANFEFDIQDDVLTAKKDGEVIKDKTRQPVPPKEVLTEFFKERKYLVEEGRGGEDSKTFAGNGKITKMSDFQEYCDKNKININGEDARVKLAEITKENKEFDFDN